MLLIQWMSFRKMTKKKTTRVTTPMDSLSDEFSQESIQWPWSHVPHTLSTLSTNRSHSIFSLKEKNSSETFFFFFHFVFFLTSMTWAMLNFIVETNFYYCTQKGKKTINLITVNLNLIEFIGRRQFQNISVGFLPVVSPTKQPSIVRRRFEALKTSVILDRPITDRPYFGSI